MTRRTRTAVAVGFAFLAIAGCGIPLDTEPRPASIEAEVADQPEPTTVEGASRAVVYLTREGKLLATVREVMDRRPATILDSLLVPPSTGEVAMGYVTQIPTGTSALAVRRTDQSVIVDLDSTFNNVIGAARQQAIAQIVFTMTELDGLGAVRFAVSGAAVDVSTPSRGDVDRVTECDFISLLPTDEDLVAADIDELTVGIMRSRRRATEGRCPNGEER